MKEKILTICLLFVNVFMFSQNENNTTQGFTVKGTKLVDANGNEFIIKGINNPHIWIPESSFEALSYIADRNANTVRIVWMTKGNADELDKIISRCIELEMIPMVELHDVTGDASPEKLLEMARYYTTVPVKKVLDKYEKYLLLNIANEWGNNLVNSEKWFAAYQTAIDTLRRASYRNTIVVDAPGWGQDIEPILAYGNKLLEYDSLRNILFSVHMYGSWNDPKKIGEKLQQAYDLNLPLIVGEFGYNYRKGKNNLGCKVNHRLILEHCNKLGYGYMPWSWTGNNEENQWLDMVSVTDWKTLTWWGKEVIEGEGGIEKTAKRASVFTQ